MFVPHASQIWTKSYSSNYINWASWQKTNKQTNKPGFLKPFLTKYWSVTKITVQPRVIHTTRSKVAPNMADPISIKDSDSPLGKNWFSSLSRGIFEQPYWYLLTLTKETIIQHNVLNNIHRPCRLGCAANMGNKISLLIYKWPFIKCKIWFINGLIFQNLPKFEPKLAQIWEHSGEIKWFWSKFGPKLSWLVYEWVTFSWKTSICMGLLSNSVATHPYQNQTWVPPPPFV